MRFVRPSLLYVAVLIVLSACSVGDPPDLPELGAATWNEFAPRGATVCADGSDYRYFVSAGTTNRLVIDFQGGGACWDARTCGLPVDDDGDGLYLEKVRGAPDEQGLGGIYERDNPDNPFRDWYHVYVSYCTADLHLGDAQTRYTGEVDGEQVDIVREHRGYENVRATLDWTFAEFERPDRILVLGSSAGGYAAPVWFADIQRRYPTSQLALHADSAAGVITDSFAQDVADNWNIARSLPASLEGFDPNERGVAEIVADDFVKNLYIQLATAYPDSRFSQYNTLADATQILFYLLAGAGQAEAVLTWTPQMLASLGTIGVTVALENDTVNVYSYLSDLAEDNALAEAFPVDTTTHVIVTREQFYTLREDGVRYADWLADFATGREVASVAPAVELTRSALEAEHIGKADKLLAGADGDGGIAVEVGIGAFGLR
ncbi:MAG: pectin acetylesterase-family hydrolase [Trueperaceae bacterium]|nr:pectin acetylesterase-family hydrolase [Trueperaceae bacterium]